MFSFFWGRKQTKRKDNLQGVAEFADEIKQKVEAHAWNTERHYTWDITPHQRMILEFLIVNIKNKAITKKNHEIVIFNLIHRYQHCEIVMPDSTGKLSADLKLFNKLIDDMKQYFKDLKSSERDELLFVNFNYHPTDRDFYLEQSEQIDEIEMQEITHKKLVL